MRFVGILLTVIGCTAVTAQPFQWTTYTSTSSVVDLVVVDGHLWAATSGGLFDYDPAAGSFDVYNNTRGLAMNLCRAIGRDEQGWIWVGAEDGRITRLNPVTGDVKLNFDLQDEIFEINAILGAGDNVFVAANNGIYRFSYRAVSDNYRVLESIRVLGGFPGETRVAALAVRDGYLYAATAQGLARASLATESLSAPSAWANFTASNAGFPQSALTSVFAAGSGLWLASANYVFSFDGGGAQQVAMLGGIKTFGESNSTLLAASANIIYRREAGGTEPWTTVGQALPAVSRIAAVQAGSGELIIVGQPDNSAGRGGLLFLDDQEQWTDPVYAAGVGGNLINAVAMSPTGELWIGAKNLIASGDAPNGVYRLRDETWEPVTRPQWIPGRSLGEIQGFGFDHTGGVWISSFGSGVAWVKGADVRYYNRADSAGFSSAGPRFAGISEDQQFVVTQVAVSARGDVYFTNRRATNFLPLVRVPAEWVAAGGNSQPWNYFAVGSSTRTEVEELIVDVYDRIWISPSSDGNESFVLDYSGTPDEVADDNWFTYAPASYQDAAYTCYNDINKQAVDYELDQQGYLWAATPQGAYYTQGGVPGDLRQLFFICVADLPIGTRVNDIHVDSQDNKWFATDEGVAVLDRNFRWVHVFQTSADADYPSDLAGRNVTAITSNPANGEVWIGTADGLSRLRTPYVSRGGELDGIWPYPNPFRADGKQRMFIDHREIGDRFDELRIYTVSGRLVRKLRWDQMINPEVGWDGRNDGGELVAGGIYLLVAAAEGGSAATGKIAVLGR